MDLSGKQKEYNSEDFKNLDLAGARLEGKEFESCTFTKCAFRGAALNTLEKTKFSLPEAISLLHSLDIILTEP